MNEPITVVHAKWRPCSTCACIDVLVTLDHPDDVPFACHECLREEGRAEVTR